MRVSLGNKNIIPTMHSSKAKIKNRTSKYSSPTVLSVKARARGLAGLAPTNFIKPNQKNTRNTENLANGTNVLLKNAISRKSKAR